MVTIQLGAGSGASAPILLDLGVADNHICYLLTLRQNIQMLDTWCHICREENYLGIQSLCRSIVFPKWRHLRSLGAIFTLTTNDPMVSQSKTRILAESHQTTI